MFCCKTGYSNSAFPTRPGLIAPRLQSSENLFSIVNHFQTFGYVSSVTTTTPAPIQVCNGEQGIAKIKANSQFAKCLSHALSPSSLSLSLSLSLTHTHTYTLTHTNISLSHTQKRRTEYFLLPFSILLILLSLQHIRLES